MSLNKYLLIIAFALFSFGVQAQTTRDVGPPTPPKPMYQKNTPKKESLGDKLFRRNVADDEEVSRFRKRMKKVSRKKRKEARLALKPQYSDPLYFGHKKPPKRRPNGKKKFCKECGLTH